MVYNEKYDIEMQQDTVIIDSSVVSVRELLFGHDNRYTSMGDLSFTKKNEAIIDLKSVHVYLNEIKYPVFEAKILKSKILFEQPKEFV